MLIAKTPLRVSFLGGGTDYREYFMGKSGTVISSTVKLYVYTTLLPLPDFATEKIRFTYRKTESVLRVDEIQHPSLRATLTHLGWSEPINIATMSDVPGNSGLGSSSSFLVGLLQVLSVFKENNLSSEELASLSVQIERDTLKEAGGMQDQYACSIGGFRSYTFTSDGVRFSSQLVSDEDLDYLSDRFSLVAVLGDRDSAILASETSSLSKSNKIHILDNLARKAREVTEFFESKPSREDLYTALVDSINYGWQVKNSYSPSMQSPKVQETIARLQGLGIDAVKLCGAGGTGFLLVAHEKNKRSSIEGEFGKGNVLPVLFERSGSRVFSLNNFDKI